MIELDEYEKQIVIKKHSVNYHSDMIKKYNTQIKELEKEIENLKQVNLLLKKEEIKQ